MARERPDAPRRLWHIPQWKMEVDTPFKPDRRTDLLRRLEKGLWGDASVLRPQFLILDTLHLLNADRL